MESGPRAAPRQFQRLVYIGDLRSGGSPEFVNAIEWRPHVDEFRTALMALHTAAA